MSEIRLGRREMNSGLYTVVGHPWDMGVTAGKIVNRDEGEEGVEGGREWRYIL